MTAERAQGTFDDPDAYQRFMGRWSIRLSLPFIDFTGLKDGDRVLDVGSGTGNLALAIAARAPHARVIAIEPSAEYVAYAQRRSSTTSIEFHVGDAHTLPFAERSFDRVMCQLVLNFIPDCRRALREMRRVARPGATIAAVLWKLGRGMRMLDEFWEAVGPSVTEARSGERRSAFTEEEVAALWNEAGLANVAIGDMQISMDFASFEDYWSPFLLGQGPAGAHAAALAPEDQVTLRERLRERLFGSRPDGPFTLTALAFAVRGTN